MEQLTSAAARRWTWVGYLVVVAVMAAGPSVLSGLISAISNAVTWPITRHWAVATGGFELFNTNVLLVYVIAVVGLNIVLQAGLLSIGQSAMMAVGAYTVAILGEHLHLAYGLEVLLAALIAGAVGLVLGLPSLRLGPFTLALMTAGYSLVATSLILALRGLTGGGDGISGVQGPASLSRQSDLYWLVAPVVVLSCVFLHNFLRSPLGRAGKAVHSSPLGAQALGISLYFVKLRAFAIGSIFGGVAGALYAPILGFVSPDSFDVSLAILLLLMVLLGGSGTLVGPLIGAVLLFRIPIAVDNVTSHPGEISLLIYGCVLMLSVYLAPKGIMSLWWAVRSRWFAKPTGTNHASAPVTPAGVHEVVAARPTPDERGTLTVAAVAKRLGGVNALSGVDLDAQPGRVHAIIGPNGSGKTTLLNVLSGYLSADSGTVSLSGDPAGRLHAHQRARRGVGRTFQTPVVFEDLTSIENVMCGLDQRSCVAGWKYVLRLSAARTEERRSYEQANRILGALGLAHRATSSASSLSPGERRLLEIARIIATAPKLVLMDEPVAGLAPSDIIILDDVIGTLKEAGIGVVLVEHHMEVVMRIADEITVLDHGRKIAHGTPAEIRRDPTVIAAYLGDEAGTVEQPQPDAAALPTGGEP